ncbi:MAG: efflux RND transporter periplasmic adaptor subunit [Thermoguttaceae bacterium]|jgi:membrane fusion protein (multidrug efflux system)|nr:efflux RND transporter periplasmic adaptor subunit [Thermoguttaceae bacterium]
MSRWERFKRWLSVLAVVLVSTAILAGVAAHFMLGWGGRSQGAVEGGSERPVVPVAIATMEAVTLKETISGVGTLEASAQVEISPEIPGRIRAIHFEEGGFVEEGDVLFELDDDRLRHERDARRAALRAAEVRAANARRIFERRQQLRDRAVFTEEAIEEAEADLHTAVAERDRLEAEVALIERGLEETKILAPFAGVISHRKVDRGAHVSIGRSLAQFYQVDPLEMNFWLPERHLGRVRRGQTVAVAVAAYPDREFAGVVEFVGPAVDPSTRQFLVKAIVPNEEHHLKPGLFAAASVVVGERKDRPVIPDVALVATRRGYMVFVVKEEVAVAREITTGLRQEGLVEIVEGLAVGEQVVREGHLRLSGGERIRIESDSATETPSEERER